VIEADERALLEESVRAALARAGGAVPADALLEQLGWRELLDADPRAAVEIVFDALGRANAAAALLDDVLAAALGAKPRADLAVLLPRFGAWDAPGRVSGERVEAHGLATSRADRAGELLVVCAAQAELRAASVPTALAQVSAVRGIDPDAGLRAVRVRGRAARAERIDDLAWQAALAAGRRAVAQQMAGAGRAMLALACAHAAERVQFGRPIARFQAVRHRLAEALVAQEALEAALGAAGDTPGPETAALAKAVAGRSARSVAAHCQQVLAGIGFTTDHPFHRYLKRVLALEGLFGSADAITLDVGRALLASRRVPTLIEL
jgi:hypothetical protein